MVEVQAHGDFLKVKDPARPGVETLMRIVVFIEHGRQGANKGLSRSSDVLSQAIGKETGLELVRTHSQPVRIEELDEFPVGRKFDTLHINRELYSSPQMRNQIDKEPRMINGKPTYFVTYLDNQPVEDKDFTLSIDVLAGFNPAKLFTAQVGATQVERSSGPDGENARVLGPNQSPGFTSRTDGGGQTGGPNAGAAKIAAPEGAGAARG
jgi:hypothetical protein